MVRKEDDLTAVLFFSLQPYPTCILDRSNISPLPHRHCLNWNIFLWVFCLLDFIYLFAYLFMYLFSFSLKPQAFMHASQVLYFSWVTTPAPVFSSFFSSSRTGIEPRAFTLIYILAISFFLSFWGKYFIICLVDQAGLELVASQSAGITSECHHASPCTLSTVPFRWSIDTVPPQHSCWASWLEPLREPEGSLKRSRCSTGNNALLHTCLSLLFCLSLKKKKKFGAEDKTEGKCSKSPTLLHLFWEQRQGWQKIEASAQTLVFIYLLWDRWC